MLSQIGGYDRPQAISSTGNAAAAGVLLHQDASGPYFGILPTEVLGRIFLRLSVASPVHSAQASRVCNRFAELTVPHRLAASMYAGADLQRGQPDAAERVARVGKTLADLKQHAASMADRHHLAILTRLVEQIRLVPVNEQARVWCQLLDARSGLPKAYRPSYVIDCLNNPVATNDLFQPVEILSSFNGILSTIAEAPAAETSELLMSAGLALHPMNACVQQQAFADLIAVCNKLDNAIRLRWLIDAVDNIYLLNDCNQPGAVDTVLQLLPRLHADDIAPVLKALLKPLTGLSDQQKAQALDAGILRMTHLADTPKRAVLKVLAECARRLPQALNERYYPALLACHRSLSA